MDYEQDVNRFLEEDVSGRCALLVLRNADCHAVMSHYLDCKRKSPHSTSAYLAMPRNCVALSQAKGFKECMTLQCPLRGCKESESGQQYGDTRGHRSADLVVMHDAAAMPSGVYPSSALPQSIVNHLCTAATSKDRDQLTFVFEGTAAGAPATVLWDSGAKLDYISVKFCRRNNVVIASESQLVELGDGTRISTHGTVRLKTTIKGAANSDRYSKELTFAVIDMSDGFDVILGDTWSRRECVVADYGSADPRAYTPPFLWLRALRTRIFPRTEPPDVADAPERKQEVPILSAIRAVRLLQQPRLGSSPPFMLMIRESKADAQENRDARLNAVLREFESVFDQPDLAEFRDFTPECVPVMADSTPPNRPPFRLSMAERREVEKQVQELLEAGRIVPSSSSYGAPVLFVPKPDGSMRMCIDYRELNKITVKNKYPMPRIDDLMDNLSGAKYFSSLDLTSGYHQLRLRGTDVEKTAFNTHIGKFEWKVLPFGLTNAPAVFQTAMHRIFGSYLNRFVCVYLDDILIFSKTEEEHLRHLKMVLQLLKDNDLKAKMKKCEFFKPELKFLGHIVSADGMKPDPAKVQTIVDWPEPVSVLELRMFLGLANYFRRYIKNYAKVARPLTDLLKGVPQRTARKERLLRWGKLSKAEAEKVEKPFRDRWTESCSSAFIALKDALVTAPVLLMPDFDKPFEVECDACETSQAVGAVLLQEGHAVAFMSKKLSGPEENYSATDMEMLGVIYALREWRCYLEHQKFTIITDHQPNTYLDRATNPHTLKRRARWLYESSAYDYEWKYKPGKQNIADPLSRAPQHFNALFCVIGADKRVGNMVRAPVACALDRPRRKRKGTCASKGGSEVGNARKATPDVADTPEAEVVPNDVIIGQFFVPGLLDRIRKSYGDLNNLNKRELKSRRLRKDDSGLLWTTVSSYGEQLYVPEDESLRRECISAVHSHPTGGHFGVQRTKAKVKEVFHWEGLAKDVEKFVRNCDSCQRVKAPRHLPKGELHPLSIPGRRWESVSMDLITDLPPTKRGFDSIVVFVDRLSKMVHLEACTKSVTAAGLARIFEERIFRYHGFPQDIVSDRDVRFRALFWKELCARIGIHHSMSTAEHPQSDGQTERANQVLEDTLRHFIGPVQNEWDERLPVVEFAMNSAINASTQASPFMLNYGQLPDTPVVAYLRGKNPQVNRFVGRWHEQLSYAKQCLEAAQDRQKHFADKHRKPAEPFKVGDQVLLHMKHFRLAPGLKLKLSPRFLGPFTVTEVIGPKNLSYRIDLPAPWHRKHNVFHVASLKRYHADGTRHPPAIPPETEDETQFTVDCITDVRGTGKNRWYLVHWLGGGETWEHEAFLINFRDKVREYWESIDQRPPTDGVTSLSDMVRELEGEHSPEGE